MHLSPTHRRQIQDLFVTLDSYAYSQGSFVDQDTVYFEGYLSLEDLCTLADLIQRCRQEDGHTASSGGAAGAAGTSG
jgi:hypothetical protein